MVARAEQFATVLGRLARAELVTVDSDDWAKLIEKGRPFSLGKDLTEAEKKKIAKAAAVKFKAIADGEEEKAEAAKAAAKAAKEKAAEEAKAAKAKEAKAEK